MKDTTKMGLCLLGIFLSSQIGWFVEDAELFNGISLLFGIGFGWYLCKVKTKKENKASHKLS